MTTYGTYTFDSENDSDCQAFTFTSDNDGNGQSSTGVISAAGTAAEFCHDTNGGNSVDVGPDYGQGGDPDGYLYTECSSPGAENDEYTMTFDTTLDASSEQWQFNFYTCQRGPSNDDNQSTCEVQINEDGGGWSTVAGGSFGGSDEDTTTTTWVSRSVDLSEGGANTNSNTQVRLLITTHASTVWHGDYGIDTVSIVGSPIGGGGTGGVGHAPYDLEIYYSSMTGSHRIQCGCSRWDVQNYNVIIETWLNKTDLNTLRTHIRPSAVGELYTILGRPRYYDKSWQGKNTIMLSSNKSTRLGRMRNNRLIFVKSITDSPIEGPSGWLSVKIEGFVSGNVNL